MAAGSTYTPIATQQVVAQSGVTFSSIPSTYTDLILVVSANNSVAGTGANNWRLNFNGDSSSLYSDTFLTGDGSSATSSRDSNQTEMYWGYANNVLNSPSNSIAQIMSYANTSIFKTVISRGNSAEKFVSPAVGLWRSTAAINSLTVGAGSATITGTITLYGIAAA